jgi:hypothetical protein
MSSSYLLNLKINALQQEIEGIGLAVGYFWNFSSSNGLTIDGSDTASTISAPDTNNTMYAVANVVRSAPWSITTTINSDSYMYVGVTTDPTKTFPSPTSPSMVMCDYGFTVNTSNTADAFYSIVSGVETGTAVTCTTGDVVTMNYDGTNITFTINGVVVTGSTIPLATLAPVYLVAGSVYGGSMGPITWSGTGSSSGGGGGTGNLEDVLAAGNNAGNQDILNVKNLSLNNYLNIGNAVGNTSQIHFNYDTGTSTTGYNWQLVASNTSTPTIEFQLYNNNALDVTPLTVRTDAIIARKTVEVDGDIETTNSGDIITDGQLQISASSTDSSTFNIYSSKGSGILSIDVEPAGQSSQSLLNINADTYTTTFLSNPTVDSYPVINVKGSNGGNPIVGKVYDSTWSIPSAYIPSNTITGLNFDPITTGSPSGTPYSLIQFQFLGSYDQLFNDFTTYISQLIFDASISSGGFNVGATFYLSDTLNGAFDQTYPIAKGAQVSLGSGGSTSISQSGLILTNLFSDQVSTLYLNVVLSGGSGTVTFTNFTCVSYTTAIATPVIGITIQKAQ